MTVTPRAAFAVATAMHAGFQLTVTSLVYPALVEVRDADWTAAHQRHSRRITPVVATVYGGLMVTGGWFVGRGSIGGWDWVALGATSGALAVTAILAAPLHGRLAPGAPPELRRRLLRVDRGRCALAFLGAVAASRAAVG